jgi:hypothetical protein
LIVRPNTTIKFIHQRVYAFYGYVDHMMLDMSGEQHRCFENEVRATRSRATFSDAVAVRVNIVFVLSLSLRLCVRTNVFTHEIRCVRICVRYYGLCASQTKTLADCGVTEAAAFLVRETEVECDHDAVEDFSSSLQGPLEGGCLCAEFAVLLLLGVYGVLS